VSGDRRFVGLVLLWQIAASSCYYTIFAATPFFREAFSLSGVALGAIVAVLTLGYTLFLVPVGTLIDARGERPVLLVGLALLAVGAAAVTVAPAYLAVLAVVIALGAAYASAIPGTNKAILEGVGTAHRNFALGIKQVGVTAGSAISAVVVTGLAGSWREGFLAIAAFAIAVNGLFFFAYRSRRPGSRAASERTDAETDDPGTDDRTSDTDADRTEPGEMGERADDEGGTLAALRRLVGYRAYRRLTAAGFFLGAALFTTVGYTVLYVAESVGTSIAFGGGVLAAVQVGGSAGRIGAGWLGDTLPGSERRATVRVLLAQTALGTVLLLGVTRVGSRLAALVAFSLLGVCVLGFTGIYYSCLGTLVPEGRIASATAGGQIALNGGALFAPPTFGLLVDSAGYDAGWGLLAVCGTIATALLLAVERGTDG
jgi:MFS family permease